MVLELSTRSNTAETNHAYYEAGHVFLQKMFYQLGWNKLSGKLKEEEIVAVCRIASRVKPDFVKTSTGFGTAGAKAEHVALMKANAGPDVKVKAAGGIRTWADAKAMLEAGAERIGTSSGVRIIGEMRPEETARSCYSSASKHWQAE